MRRGALRRLSVSARPMATPKKTSAPSTASIRLLWLTSHVSSLPSGGRPNLPGMRVRPCGPGQRLPWRQPLLLTASPARSFSPMESRRARPQHPTRIAHPSRESSLWRSGAVSHEYFDKYTVRIRSRGSCLAIRAIHKALVPRGAVRRWRASISVEFPLARCSRMSPRCPPSSFARRLKTYGTLPAGEGGEIEGGGAASSSRNVVPRRRDSRRGPELQALWSGSRPVVCVIDSYPGASETPSASAGLTLARSFHPP